MFGLFYPFGYYRYGYYSAPYQNAKLEGIAEDNKLQTREMRLQEMRRDIREAGLPAASYEEFNKISPGPTPESRVQRVGKDALKWGALGAGVVLVADALIQSAYPATPIGGWTMLGGLSGACYGGAHGFGADLDNDAHDAQLQAYNGYLTTLKNNLPQLQAQGALSPPASHGLPPAANTAGQRAMRAV